MKFYTWFYGDDYSNIWDYSGDIFVYESDAELDYTKNIDNDEFNSFRMIITYHYEPKNIIILNDPYGTFKEIGRSTDEELEKWIKDNNLSWTSDEKTHLFNEEKPDNIFLVIKELVY